jgi:hypothetical protein
MEDEDSSKDISDYEDEIDLNAKSASVEVDLPSEDADPVEFVRVGKYFFSEKFKDLHFCGKPIFSHLKVSLKSCAYQFLGTHVTDEFKVFPVGSEVTVEAAYPDMSQLSWVLFGVVPHNKQPHRSVAIINSGDDVFRVIHISDLRFSAETQDLSDIFSDKWEKYKSWVCETAHETNNWGSLCEARMETTTVTRSTNRKEAQLAADRIKNLSPSTKGRKHLQ